MTGFSTGSIPVGSSVQDPKNPRIVGKGDEATDKEMFLQLMIAQLKNQDPTAPMDQKDMMSSITQFSQAEQMQNMVTALESLSLAQGVNTIGQYVNYQYTAKDPNTGETAVDEIRMGKVVSVGNNNGTVQLVLDNGVKVDPTKVTSVSAEPRPPQTMMDRYVKFSVDAIDSSGKPVTVQMQGKVTSLTGTGDDAQIMIGSLKVDPSKVFAMSDNRFTSPGVGGRTVFPESLPSGYTYAPTLTPSATPAPAAGGGGA